MSKKPGKKVNPQRVLDKTPLAQATIRDGEGRLLVRKGHRTGFRRATQAEVEGRVEFVAGLLRTATSRVDIHRAVQEKYKLHWATADLYILKGRKWLRDRASISFKEAKEKSLDVLLHIMEKGADKDRIAAEKRFGEIMGYDAPRQLALGNFDGSNLEGAKTLVHAPVVNFVIIDNGRSAPLVLAEKAGG